MIRKLNLCRLAKNVIPFKIADVCGEKTGSRPASVNSKRGSMITEAAIVFPIYIIAVVTLCWLVKACFLETAVFCTSCSELQKESISIVHGIGGAGADIEDALERSGVDGSQFHKKAQMKGISEEGVGGFDKLKYSYDTRIKMPLPFVKEIKLENEIVYHKWDGYSRGGSPFPFAQMEQDGDGDPVIIFPRTGGRYHSKTCRYANAYPQTTTLSPGIRKKYSRCRLCTEGDESDGQTVYIFKYGGSYHESDCSAVDKFIMTMDRKDAVKKGYTPCSVCGGG
ncbi:MAG: hypothetical protein SOV71_01870 [Anaerovoracaceae bacterium]|nr:hypothetical protein [Bacillota bacterium]MDY2670288.1 hypothetical protein [Anaerovoracaceae bacterium]